MQMSSTSKRGNIDLHIHTTASDGTLHPAEVVQLAHKQSMSAIAITDHDTLDGLDEAIEAGQSLGVEVIPGIEISARYLRGTIHILGYFINYHDPELSEMIDYLKAFRIARNEKMIKKFHEAGIDITMKDLLKEAHGGLVARPHFAKVLYEKGITKSIEEAFDRFLDKGAPTYVGKARLTPEKSIELIRNNGGIAVVAHPITLRGEYGCEIERIVKELVGYGVQGIEVYYSTHTPDLEAEYLEYAKKYDLLVTGGSDFHGSVKAEWALGSGTGNLNLDISLLDDMKNYLRGQGRSDI